MNTSHTQQVVPLQQIADVIQQHQRFLVTAHMAPDGDAIGSSIALLSILEALGKDVILFNDVPYPAQFHFLTHADRVQTQLPDDAGIEVSILCDCGDVARSPLHLLTKEQRGLFLVVDHHATSALEGDLNFNDPDAPCVGILIYQLGKLLGVDIDLPAAKAIYCSLVSDTGGFRYQKTSPKAFRLAAELLEIGVDPWEISSGLYESNPLERQRLLARTLDTIEIDPTGQLAYLTITEEMYEQTGADQDMTDGFINFARGVKGIEAAVLFRQKGDDAWKLSMRSRGKIDVSQVSSQFGGGGHHNAAGAVIEGTLEEAKAIVTKAMETYLASKKNA
ncbi:MAG: DHH family phosphoesterase [Deltaproteobacteria bacterium]|nr:DHH family phosphoesterase [Deltaproteobacteria bacterium]MBU47336.1 DHH family phosphoesterase [Deltaproteobacteria bacterium]|tara:strand:+ start:13384 stop:14385 length:1002 start_codon:yes stop_codon:yes gene_type:complete